MRMTPPDDADMQPTALPAAASLDAVLRYQESLWARGMRTPVEELLSDRPALRNLHAMLELICNEVILREEAGESPLLEEYEHRYPNLAEPLRIQWQIDGLLASRRSFRQHRGGSHRPSTDSTTAGYVGRYEIQGVLGKGGMGIAYRAWDTQLKRVVALKMLRSEVAGEEELARFRTEAEAIARLRHPNVVQVFDVGEHAGRPFFAMEFCAGGSLADRLDGSPLPDAEAARVIEQVARGVAAAHLQQVIHRDLKPGNVLIGLQIEDCSVQPEPPANQGVRSPSRRSASCTLQAAILKVTDFGLAKQLDAEQAQTYAGAVMGTPVYMAPEQAFGGSRDVGPAADVYALGAILYECLTGRPPFKGATVADTLDMVRHREPVPVRQLQPRTPRDLETICLKCLRKEPEKRYATAQELADDLGRYLEGRPIVARPVGPIGKAWRWAKRNPVVASLLTLVLVVLTAGAVSTTLALRRSWRSETEAKVKQAEAEQALEDEFRAVDTAFTKVSEDRLLEQPGMLELRRELVKASLPFYQDFATKRRDDPRWRRQLTTAVYRLGVIQKAIGAFPEAIAAFEESLVLCGRLRDESGVAEVDLEVGANVNLGDCYRLRHAPDQADAAYARADALYKNRQGSDLARAEILHYRAIVAMNRNDLPRCIEQSREAVRRLTKFRDHRGPLELISARITVAQCLEKMNKCPEAIRELQAAQSTIEEQIALRSRLSTVYRLRIAHVRGVQGRLYNRLANPKQAEPHLRAAGEELRRLRDDFPTVPKFAFDWAINQAQFVASLILTRDFTRADKLNEEVVRELERLRRDDPGYWDYYRELGSAYARAARIARDTGSLEQSLKMQHKRLALTRRWVADHAWAKADIGAVAGSVAQVLTQMNRYAESLEYWDLCLQHGGAPDPVLIRAYRTVARAITGNWRQAEQDVRDIPATPQTHPTIIFILGCVHAAMAEAAAKDDSLAVKDRTSKKEAWTKTALALLAEAKRRGHPGSAWDVRQWKTERSLESLRELPEFRAMLPE